MDKRYNIYHKRLISLNEGEQFCPKCGGKGKVKDYNKYRLYKSSLISLVCNKCLGDGKIDWIETAIGKSSRTLGSYRESK